jgi:hypothetical protein
MAHIRRRRWPWVALGAVALLGAAGYIVYGGSEHEGPGTVTRAAPTPRALADRRVRASVPGAHVGKQILFGDLHVHTTFSADAFMRSLPFVGGEGAHPPSDACDYARFCSSLDFFAITDHAESLTARHWRETLESLRQCQGAADPEHPDLVAFAGWEWTQTGRTPEEHHGHKNVILRDLEEGRLPARVIAAPGLGAAFRSLTAAGGGLANLLLVPLLEFPRRQRYLNFVRFIRENRTVDECPAGVDTRELPLTCREVAHTPRELFEKLAQWTFPALVIPHGTTWGFYTPPGYTYDRQLTRSQRDPERQRLIEIYSGHGNSEEHRPWRAVARDAQGNPVCPQPTPGYEPCCWRAGEIVRARCGSAPPEECERRVREARANYLAFGVSGHQSLPGATVEDWKDCGQCRDCFNPSFNYRPGGSAQYALARGSFEAGERYHERLGFIASSDNHSARPGTGYKELARRRTTETAGPVSEAWRDRIFGKPPPPADESVRYDPAAMASAPAFRVYHLERQVSFFMTGGLVAVHAAGRTRQAIWEALWRREVYATSGDRILLWFDLEHGGGPRPMGSRVELSEPPRFRVRAAGAFHQKPGCPEDSLRALGAARMQRLCGGECHHPGDARRRVTRIEVVRILPQQRPDEPIDGLIEDPWRRMDCPRGDAVCAVSFDDPDFPRRGRDAVYYVRAIQEPTPAVNAGGARCERDAAGRCLRARPCHGDYRTPASDDCLTDNEERAWSSPIYVGFRAAR